MGKVAMAVRVYWTRPLFDAMVTNGSNCTDTCMYLGQFLAETATEKMSRILARIFAYRAAEEARMQEEGLAIGDVTTVNVTKCAGGVQYNVVPEVVTLALDVRLTPYLAPAVFEATVLQGLWLAGEVGVTVRFVQRSDDLLKVTPLDQAQGTFWWEAVKETFSAMQLSYQPAIFPAATGTHPFSSWRSMLYSSMPLRDT